MSLHTCYVGGREAFPQTNMKATGPFPFFQADGPLFYWGDHFHYPPKSVCQLPWREGSPPKTLLRSGASTNQKKGCRFFLPGHWASEKKLGSRARNSAREPGSEPQELINGARASPIVEVTRLIAWLVSRARASHSGESGTGGGGGGGWLGLGGGVGFGGGGWVWGAQKTVGGGL